MEPKRLKNILTAPFTQPTFTSQRLTYQLALLTLEYSRLTGETTTAILEGLGPVIRQHESEQLSKMAQAHIEGDKELTAEEFKRLTAKEKAAYFGSLMVRHLNNPANHDTGG